MDNFKKIYNSLNDHQKLAVNTIDGPLLVIAGPGTGKTQLLSARVANILIKTDTTARNILCLTFTENGAENMRERLVSFIGQTAYDVTISTYHAFGDSLIGRFPEYFTETKLQNAVDELLQYQIISELLGNLSYTNPLKYIQHNPKDIRETISQIKRALLTSNDLRLMVEENSKFFEQSQPAISEALDDLVDMSKFKEVMPIFSRLLDVLSDRTPKLTVNRRFGSMAQSAVLSLAEAVSDAQESGKTKTLTSWKNDWLIKDSFNKFKLTGEAENKRLKALADFLDDYQKALSERGLYDFDDMIVRSIDVLSANEDLRLTLQEQYQYVLLDEFQDTNPAQLQLIELLTNNPLNEGRPNIMAVGDDDQAIYAFQGAQYSNMLDFYNNYQQTAVINLTDNYRSHADILVTAQNIASQIEDRLHSRFEGKTGTLKAVNSQLPKQATIERQEFISDIAQAEWIAQKIKKLINQGTKPQDIVVLSPTHRLLESLVPYLNKLHIPVHYEKRENILEAPVIKQLLSMSRLVLALHNNDLAQANSLWPEVLSYDFWHIPTSEIWKIAWQISDNRQSTNLTGSWSQLLLDGPKSLRLPALLFLTLANIVEDESYETILDYLIGSSAIITNEKDLPKIYSPLRNYYTDRQSMQSQPELFYETLSHLTVLRAKLRKHQNTLDEAMSLGNLIEFVNMYDAASEPMINTSPYYQQLDSVQLMTVYKAKGLEFKEVFLPSCQDDVWGSTAKTNNNHLKLPANLAPTRSYGLSNDERLRLLYVAITRAKVGLYLSSVRQSYDGKINTRLRFFNEQEQSDQSFKALVLPVSVQTIINNEADPPPLDLLELDWRHKHLDIGQQAELRALLSSRLKHYQLSPTDFNRFLDVKYGGPESLFFKSILHFPEAPSDEGQFGSAIHETLEWYQNYLTQQGVKPKIKQVIDYFVIMMQNKRLTPRRTEIEIEKGRQSLSAYLESRSSIFKPTNIAEQSFRNENVFVGNAHLSGKVDHLEIDSKNKTITVVDYKTGESFSKLSNDLTLLNHIRQLYCYKLIIENSTTYKSYKVNAGRLEFIVPDNSGNINFLNISFTDNEISETTQLLEIVWQHIQQLDFPDISKYKVTAAGVKKLKSDLLEGKI